VIGGLVRILAGGLARRALGVILSAVAVQMFLMNLRRIGERAGRLAERLEILERSDAIQRQMLEAAGRRPHDRDALARRLRDGRF
jgi:hypothetical protein